MKKYYVVDQNYLRKDELAQMLTAQPCMRIIIPDLAFLEMTKGSNQELTLRKSLSVLSRFASRVFVCRSIGWSLKQELDQLKPTKNLLSGMDLETSLLRSVLNSLQRDPESAEVERLLHQSEEHLQRLHADYYDHDNNKSRAILLVDSLKRDTSANFMSKIRSNNVTIEERMNFVSEKSTELLLEALCGNRFNIPIQVAKKYIRLKPMQLRFYYLSIWLALDWTESGRVEGMNSSKVTNDYLDREYILSATYFNELLTKEKRMKVAYEALSRFLQNRHIFK